MSDEEFEKKVIVLVDMLISTESETDVLKMAQTRNQRAVNENTQRTLTRIATLPLFERRLIPKL